MAYPNHNFPFHVYTDASNYHLQGITIQLKHESKKNHLTMEKDLVSIIIFLEEFRSMPLGVELFIHIDHKNLTFAN
ncbi:hypothetical protein ACHAXS_001564 [Conticribra weissflogii]